VRANILASKRPFVTVFLNCFKYCILWLLYENFLLLKSEGARVRNRDTLGTDGKNKRYKTMSFT
jgi:hypothetical protein